MLKKRELTLTQEVLSQLMNKCVLTLLIFFAIGDVIGNPMLAHKAIPEGRIAAEIIAGINTHPRSKLIPSVAYTDPEIAVVGLSETKQNNKGLPIKKRFFHGWQVAVL